MFGICVLGIVCILALTYIAIHIVEHMNNRDAISMLKGNVHNLALEVELLIQQFISSLVHSPLISCLLPRLSHKNPTRRSMASNLLWESAKVSIAV